ncbi:hypothetical protein ACFBZI_10655 [Moraxella sp. ZJ142]|uniref:hypothetical protein n=1 Tax=Moraxella marmotae TaxID=3344520 RepID=UPI0035D4DA72
MKLNPQEIAWIASEYQAGRTLQEIAIDTGMSCQNVKRALAEAGLLNLSWYKTKEEQLMLEYLTQLGITGKDDLTSMLNKGLLWG